MITIRFFAGDDLLFDLIDSPTLKTKTCSVIRFANEL
jgi:hypothetical protein